MKKRSVQKITVLNRKGKLPRCAKYSRSFHPCLVLPRYLTSPIVPYQLDYNLATVLRTCGAGCLSPGEIGNRKLESVPDFFEVNLSPWNISFRRFWVAPHLSLVSR